MRGTPGFVGTRLREAREVRDVTGVSLADMIGVSPQTVSLYENDKSSPSAETLDAISSHLRLPRDFFIRPARSASSRSIFYRSMASTTARARTRAARRFDWLRDIVDYLTEYVALPPANFPRFDVPDDPVLLDDDEIEQAAGAARRFWGMGDGPVANMVLLLENQGAVVARDRLGAESLDGLSEFDHHEGRPYIVIGTDKGTPVRWRFDAAHELGHILLHANVKPEVFRRPNYFKLMETQAHRFAASFLVPLQPFSDDLLSASLDAMRAIKPKWKVSIGVMINRARHADMISEDTARTLWINHTRRGWRRNEPGDDSMQPEEPRVLRRAFELVLENGAQTADDIVSRLALPLFDVEALCGLTPGYLHGFAPVSLREDFTDDSEYDQPAQVIPLRPRQSQRG